MSKLIYNKDYSGILEFLGNLFDYPEILEPALRVFVASVNVRMFYSWDSIQS